MENKLKKLFDYQRFEQNDKLEKLIHETESRYARELSDEDLSLVNAAGEPEADKIRGGSTPQKEKQIGGMNGDFIGNYADDNDAK